MTKKIIESLYGAEFTVRDVFSMPIDKLSISFILSIIPLSIFLHTIDTSIKTTAFEFLFNTCLLYGLLFAFYMVHSVTGKRLKTDKTGLIQYIDIDDKLKRLHYFSAPSNIYLNDAVNYNPFLMQQYINSDKPLIIRNDFFNNNIVTLITNKSQLKKIKIDRFNSNILTRLIGYGRFNSSYITPVMQWNKKDKNKHFVIVNIVNSIDLYFNFYKYLKHYYSNDEIRCILFSSVFYHESNHASFLQNKLDLNKSEFEAVSDIASVIKLKQVFNMSTKQFSSLLKAMSSNRESEHIYSKYDSHYFNVDCFVLLEHINKWNGEFFNLMENQEITDFAIIMKVYLSLNIYDFNILNLIHPFYSKDSVIESLNKFNPTNYKNNPAAYKNAKKLINEFTTKYNLIEYLAFKNANKDKNIYNQNFNCEPFFVSNYECRESIIEEAYNNLPERVSLRDILQYSMTYNKEFYNSIVYEGQNIYHEDSVCSFFKSYGYNIKEV